MRYQEALPVVAGLGLQAMMFSIAYLARHPDCCVSGCDQRASHADHVMAIGKGGGGYAEENLQPLCGDHHSQKTAIFDRPTRPSKKTRLSVRGASADGRPLDPLHPWNSGKKS
jgi:hypothetical protein